MGFGHEQQCYDGLWMDSRQQQQCYDGLWMDSRQQQQQHQSYSMHEEEAWHSSYSGPGMHMTRPGAASSVDYDHFSKHHDKFGGNHRLHTGGVGHQGGWFGHDKLQNGNWHHSNSHGHGYGGRNYPYGGGKNKYPNSYGHYEEYGSEGEEEYQSYSEGHRYGSSTGDVDRKNYYGNYGYNYYQPKKAEWAPKGV